MELDLNIFNANVFGTWISPNSHKDLDVWKGKGG